MAEIVKINDICYYINFNEGYPNYSIQKENLFTYTFLKNLKEIFHKTGGGFGYPLMLIVCTQNSPSCEEEHFQHLFRNILKKMGELSTISTDYLKDIHLIDKADATASSYSTIMSCLGNKKEGIKHPFNCRTRIYGNKYLFSKEHTFSFMEDKLEEGILYKKQLPKFNSNDKSAFIIECEKRIISLDRNGKGGILFNILLRWENKNYRYIICNSNLPESSSNEILSRLKENLSYNGPLTLIMASPNVCKFTQFTSNVKNIFSNKPYNIVSTSTLTSTSNKNSEEYKNNGIGNKNL